MQLGQIVWLLMPAVMCRKKAKHHRVISRTDENGDRADFYIQDDRYEVNDDAITAKLRNLAYEIEKQTK